jgi:hypothetical protein
MAPIGPLSPRRVLTWGLVAIVLVAVAGFAVVGLGLLWSGRDPRVRERHIVVRGADQIPEPEPGT